LQAKHAPPAAAARKLDKSKKSPTAKFSLLASLAPLVYETADGCTVLVHLPLVYGAPEARPWLATHRPRPTQVDGSVLGCDFGKKGSAFEYADITTAKTSEVSQPRHPAWPPLCWLLWPTCGAVPTASD
jgi:hypothetical protein